MDRRQDQAFVLDAMRDRSRLHRRVLVGIAVATPVVGAVLLTSGRHAIDDAMPGGSGRWIVLAVAAVLLLAAVALLGWSRRGIARSSDRLARLTAHDPLTGLPNRQFLGAPLDDLLRRARRVNARVGIFLVEVDGIAVVNEANGRDVGDELVRGLAERLAGVMGPEDHLVRSGGSEFMVLCTDVPSARNAEVMVAKLLRAVAEPFRAGPETVQLQASIGVALAEQRCSRPDEVLTDADVARRQAVAGGPGSYALFDRAVSDVMTPSTAQRLLREALDGEQFSCYYQPVVSLWTRRLVGVEALVRWESPTRGVISPGEFIATLEDTGLIVPVGHWVLEEVCSQARIWNDRFPDRPPLATKVNVSARQLVQADFASSVVEVLARHGVPPNQLLVEVSEAALTVDLDAAWQTLAELRQAGVGIAVDDFGTGFSSLTYLRELAADVLAIDKSFIDGITASRDERMVVSHMIALAKSLGIVTVAEGVEHEEQVEVLRELSCDLGQGYYFSHPQPASTIGALLDADGTAHEWDPGARPGRGLPATDEGAPEDERQAESDRRIERFQRGPRR